MGASVSGECTFEIGPGGHVSEICYSPLQTNVQFNGTTVMFLSYYYTSVQKYD